MIITLNFLINKIKLSRLLCVNLKISFTVFLITYYFLNLSTPASSQIISIPDECIYRNINIDPDNKSFDDLSFLDSLIGDAQVVLLGELEHGEANIDSIKVRIVKYLHEKKGFDVLAFESGIYSIAKADTMMHHGLFAEDALSNEIFSIWTGFPTFQNLLKYLDSTYHEWKIVGFDSQMTGDDDEDIGDNLLRFLNDYKIKYNRFFLDEWIETAEDIVHNELPQFNQIAFNEADSYIRDKIEDIIKLNPEKPEPKLWLRIIISVYETAFFLQETKGKKWEAKDNNIRDNTMAENLLFWINQYPNKKFVCWGASGHFAMNTICLENKEINDFIPMGSYIKKELREKVYSIGTIGFSGKIGWDWNTHGLPVAPENSIEYAMHLKKCNNAFIDLRGVDTITFGANPFIWRYEFGTWAKTFNAFIYFDEILPKVSSSYSGQIAPNNSVNKDTLSSNYSLGLNPTDILKFNVIKGEYKTVLTGMVWDGKTKIPLPFASVGLQNYLYGTLTDTSGHFELKLPSINYSDTLIVSYVGYERKFIPLRSLRKTGKVDIELIPKKNILPEVIINSKYTSVIAIIRHVIDLIPKNYLCQPYKRMILYSMKSMDTVSNAPSLLEWTGIQYYPNGYELENKRSSIDFKAQRSRIGQLDKTGFAMHNFKTFKEPNVQFKYIGGLAFHDFIEHRKYNLFNKKKLKYYNLVIGDITETDDGVLYRIDFECRRPSFRTALAAGSKKFDGSVYINSNDYAIVKIETNAVFDKKYDKNPGTNKMDRIMRKIIYYKKIDGKYVLSQVNYFDNCWLKNFADIYYFDYVTGTQKIKTSYNFNDLNKPYDPGYWKDVYTNVFK